MVDQLGKLSLNMRLPSLIHRLSHRTFVSHARRLSKAKTSTQHQDIPSFIRYAESVSLSPETTVYVGTLYEYTVFAALSALRMKLDRCGSPGDRGIDIRGTWAIPRSPKEASDSPGIIPVIVSCKAQKTKSGPAQIRELEGALGSSSQDTIGILATVSSCTSGAMRQMLLSKRPLAYCYVKPYTDGGEVQQFVWNKQAGVLLQGLGVKMEYASRKGEEGEDIEGKLILTFNGRALRRRNVKKLEGS